MTNTPHPVPLHTAVARERERHRALLDAAARWQEGRPQRSDPDLFALLCAAAASSLADDVAPTRWTRTGTCAFLRRDLPNWCSLRRVRRPEGDIAALWQWFDFLHATDRLDPAGDPVTELRKPLTCAGWLDQDGRPLPEGAPRQVECECFLPYREGAQLLGAFARRATDRGEDVLRPLRRALAGTVWCTRCDDDVLIDLDLPDLDLPGPGDGPGGWSASGP